MSCVFLPDFICILIDTILNKSTHLQIFIYFSWYKFFYIIYCTLLSIIIRLARWWICFICKKLLFYLINSCFLSAKFMKCVFFIRLPSILIITCNYSSEVICPLTSICSSRGLTLNDLSARRTWLLFIRWSWNAVSNQCWSILR